MVTTAYTGQSTAMHADPSGNRDRDPRSSTVIDVVSGEAPDVDRTSTIGSRHGFPRTMGATTTTVLPTQVVPGGGELLGVQSDCSITRS